MATVTSGRRVDVSANPPVLGIGVGLGVGVAVDAREHLVVGGIGMAVAAGGPYLSMGAGVDRELAMGESSAGPGGGGVTIRAGGGESGRGVVGVVGGGVLGFVARVTVRGRARKDVVDVAACAGRVDVRPGERELGGAVIE